MKYASAKFNWAIQSDNGVLYTQIISGSLELFRTRHRIVIISRDGTDPCRSWCLDNDLVQIDKLKQWMLLNAIYMNEEIYSLVRSLKFKI